MRLWSVIAMSAVVTSTLACAGGDIAPAPSEPAAERPKRSAPAKAASKLKPASRLKAGCYGQPAAAWTKRNHAEAEIFVAAGDAMTDFTLTDIDGREHTLSTLLATKPVLLLTGSRTCPEYRGNRPKADRLAGEFGDRLHVVAVHGPEAHPQSDPSPYKGRPKPDEYSDVDLATSFAERAANARAVGDAPGLTVLVEPLDNPVWCTVGTLPSAALLIAQDGTIAAAHDWFDPPSMVRSVQALVGR